MLWSGTRLTRLARLGVVSALAGTVGYGWSSTTREVEERERGGETASTSKGWLSLKMGEDDLTGLMILLRTVRNIVFDSSSLGPGISGNITRVLDALSSSPTLVNSMLSAGDEHLVRWLLDQLRKAPETAERKGAEHILAQMLKHPASARLLLSHSDLFPALLDYIVVNKFSDVSAALKEASRVIVLGSPSSPRVVEKVLDTLQKTHAENDQDYSLSHICCWALACWSKSEEARAMLQELESLAAISEVLSKGPPLEDEDRAMLLETTFNLLPCAESASAGTFEPSIVKKLLIPIIHNGAHAVANLDEDLLACTINCLASLLEARAIEAETMQSEIDSIALLLKLISKTFFIEADLCKDPLRAALARFIRASARCEDEFRIIETEIWVPRLMTWLFESSKPQKYTQASNPLGGSKIAAEKVYKNSLEAMISLMGEERGNFGIQIAREWLARFALALCSFHEQEAAKYERGGATIGMLEERVRETKDASSELLSACRNATITAVSPPKLPPGVQEVDANLPKAYAAAAIQVDEAVASMATSKAMNALGDLLSDNRLSQDWFLKSGALCLLHKIASIYHDKPLSEDQVTSLDKVLSRLLALLSVHDSCKSEMRSSEYEKWLRRLSTSTNSRVSSNAERALLNSKSKVSVSGKCLEILDGVHLLVPNADHHIKLVDSCNCNKDGSNCDIEADIVFVHGLFGGAFSSWRPGTVKMPSESQQSWPAMWLAKTNPKLRLLSVEYQTKVFDSEGSQHSFRELTSKMLKKLSAAGVGQRPVIFVTHSMGGLMVKEMMMQGAESDGDIIDKSIQDIVTNTKGVVFFSTPHHGSWIATASWNLFYIRGLKDFVSILRPGPYLEELNDFFKSFCKARDIPVLSFSESDQTHLMGLSMVKAEVVPAESAYPGFGDFHVLESDHIQVCKPVSESDPSYKKVETFIEKALEERDAGANTTN